MVKKYQETANFVSGVLDVTELQNISPFMSKPQKFSIQRVLVLSDADYQLFVNDDFRRPPVVIRAKQRYMGFDVKKKAWNCLLVVSEISKDGILVGKEPDAGGEYMAYVPDHTTLNLPSDLPVEFWTNVCTTTLQLQPSAEGHPPMTEQENRQQHFASFVGMQLSTVCFDLRFMSYDSEKDEITSRAVERRKRSPRKTTSRASCEASSSIWTTATSAIRVCRKKRRNPNGKFRENPEGRVYAEKMCIIFQGKTNCQLY